MLMLIMPFLHSITCSVSCFPFSSIGIPNAVTYETIIRALFHKDENEKAEKLLRKMIATGRVTLGKLISSFTMMKTM